MVIFQLTGFCDRQMCTLWGKYRRGRHSHATRMPCVQSHARLQQQFPDSSSYSAHTKRNLYPRESLIVATHLRRSSFADEMPAHAKARGKLSNRTPPLTPCAGELQSELASNTGAPGCSTELTCIATSSSDSTQPLLESVHPTMATASSLSNTQLPVRASFRLLLVSLFFGLASLAWGYVTF